MAMWSSVAVPSNSRSASWPVRERHLRRRSRLQDDPGAPPAAEPAAVGGCAGSQLPRARWRRPRVRDRLAPCELQQRGDHRLAPGQRRPLALHAGPRSEAGRRGLARRACARLVHRPRDRRSRRSDRRGDRRCSAPLGDRGGRTVQGRVQDRMVEILRQGAHGGGGRAHGTVGIVRRRGQREGRAGSPERDHKRARDGDAGPNTGGMGAFSPTAVLPDDQAQTVAAEVIAPIAAALAKRGTPYRGVLYAGLMKTKVGWKVLEYNARFGDPEAEVTLPRIEGDFAKLLLALGEGRLAEYVAAEPIRFSRRAYVDVVLCAENYPGPPRTGMAVEGLDRLPESVFAFHGATKRGPAGNVIVNGGRVMHMVASGDNIAEARDRAYAGAERVTFEGKFYRSDIAQQEVAVA